MSARRDGRPLRRSAASALPIICTARLQASQRNGSGSRQLETGHHLVGAALVENVGGRAVALHAERPLRPRRARIREHPHMPIPVAQVAVSSL